MTQATMTLFGSPDSFDVDRGEMVAVFGSLRIHLPDKTPKAAALKIEAIFVHGTWIAASVLCLNAPPSAPDHPPEPIHQSTASMGHPSDEPTTIRRQRLTPEQRSQQGPASTVLPLRSPFPEPQKDSPFKKLTQKDPKPTEPSSSRPAFNPDSDDSLDDRIPF